MADVRDRRRRADRRRAGRARSPSCRGARCATTSATSTPTRRGSCCSTRSTLCFPPTRSACAGARSATSRSSASRCASAPGSSASTRPASTSTAATRIEARTKIWAAGVQASPLGRILADRAGAVVDRSGRVEVSPDCSLPGHPEVFVVGDLMALDGLPGLAEVAMQSGHHAARTIVRAAARSRAEAVPLRRSRHDGHHLPVPGGGERSGGCSCRLPRVARLAGGPPRLPHRIQEPLWRWPTGPSRSSGAAGANAPSPSRKCSRAYATSKPRVRITPASTSTTRRRARHDDQQPR